MAYASDEYLDVFDLIDEDTPFDFSRYHRDEQEHLTPALAKVGYTVVRWFDGETDSFGPLSRVALAKDEDGNHVHLIYG